MQCQGAGLPLTRLLPLLEAVEAYVRLLLHHPGSNRGLEESTTTLLHIQLMQRQRVTNFQIVVDSK